MHSAHEFLTTLALVLGVAAVTTVLFQRLRQPVVLGYILAGLIVGPHVADPARRRPRDRPDALRARRDPADVLARARVQPRQAGDARAHRRAHRAAPVRASWSGSASSPARSSAGPRSRASSPARCIAISSTTIIAKAFDEQRHRAAAARARGRHPDRRGPDRDPADGGAHRDRDRRRPRRRRARRSPPAGCVRSWSALIAIGLLRRAARGARDHAARAARDDARRQHRLLLRASRCSRRRSATRWRSAPSSPARWSRSPARSRQIEHLVAAGARHVRGDLLRLGRHADRPRAGDREHWRGGRRAHRCVGDRRQDRRRHASARSSPATARAPRSRPA